MQIITVRFVILGFLSVMFLTPAAADSIETVQVTVSGATFQSTSSTCTVCTATVNMSFEFFQSEIPSTGIQVPATYGIVPGTLSIDVEGFLPGPFTGGGVDWTQRLMSFHNAALDDFDILANRNFGTNRHFFEPGESNDLQLFSCRSAECQGAFLPGRFPGIMGNTAGTVTVTRVPEPGQTLIFVLEDLFGLAILACFPTDSGCAFRCSQLD